MGLGILLGLGVLVLAYAAFHKAGGAAALPVTLPSTGVGGPGVTASSQEIQSATSTAEQVGEQAASGNIAGAAVSAVSGLITQLTQHSQRLGDAQAENTAMQPAVTAYDADLAAIAQAYRGGQLTPAQVAQAISALDNNIYAYLHSLVGKPGTAWAYPRPSITTTQSPVNCNTACTVSCCVYNADLHPPLYAIYCAMTGQPIDSVWGPGGQMTIVSGGFVMNIPEVFPPSDPAYGNYSRAGYQISFVAAKETPSSLLSSVL